MVEAPQASEIFVVTEDPTESQHSKLVIRDAPDAIPVKGTSFTVLPETLQQEIQGWIAMTSGNTEALPTPAITWKWYKNRKSISLSEEQKIEVAKYCLLTNVPVFYWLQNCEAAKIKKQLVDMLTLYQKLDAIGDIVSTSAFLGNRFHKSIIAQLGSFKTRIAPAQQNIPSSGPKVFFRANNVRPKPLPSGEKYDSTKTDNEILEEELDEIATSAESYIDHQPPLMSRWRAQSLDCFLYAQDDQYTKKK